MLHCARHNMPATMRHACSRAKDTLYILYMYHNMTLSRFLSGETSITARTVYVALIVFFLFSLQHACSRHKDITMYDIVARCERKAIITASQTTVVCMYHWLYFPIRTSQYAHVFPRRELMQTCASRCVREFAANSDSNQSLSRFRLQQ